MEYDDDLARKSLQRIGYLIQRGDHYVVETGHPASLLVGLNLVASVELEQGALWSKIMSAMNNMHNNQGHQTRITKLHRSALNRFDLQGFEHPALEKPKNTDHETPYDGARKCSGKFRDRAHLGHVFETDIVHLSIDAVSLPSTDAEITLALIDAVLAGAGFAKLIAKKIGAVFEAAYTRFSRCECGLDSSCYQRLRSFKNQREHVNI